MSALCKYLIKHTVFILLYASMAYAQQSSASWGISGSSGDGAYRGGDMKHSSTEGARWGEGKEQYGESWTKEGATTVVNSKIDRNVIHSNSKIVMPPQKENKPAKSITNESNFHFKSIKMRPPSRIQAHGQHQKGTKKSTLTINKKDTLKDQPKKSIAFINKSVNK